MEITPTIYDDLWFGRIHPPRSRYAICYYSDVRPGSIQFAPLYYCKKQEYSDSQVVIYEAGETTATGRTYPGSIVGRITLPLDKSLVAMSPLR